jgi:hypothetical protein
MYPDPPCKMNPYARRSPRELEIALKRGTESDIRTLKHPRLQQAEYTRDPLG